VSGCTDAIYNSHLKLQHLFWSTLYYSRQWESYTEMWREREI